VTHSPAPVRDGGAETVDEQHGRALPPDEVVHAHPSPHPGSAASAHLLQGQRRRQRLGGSDPTARGSAREDAGGGPATGAAMERRVREGERGGAAAAASSWRDGGGGEQAVVGGKCCHIHPGSTSGCRACFRFLGHDRGQLFEIRVFSSALDFPGAVDPVTVWTVFRFWPMVVSACRVNSEASLSFGTIVLDNWTFSI
jgi:hypothetical protein